MQHVSATFRKNSIINGTEADHSKKQVVLFKPQETAIATSNNAPNDTKLSFGGAPELQGLSIINQGQLTLHYHSYNAAPSTAYQSAPESRKHTLEKDENEQYSEALASLMDCDLSPQDRPKPLPSAKRLRFEEPEELETEMVEPEAQISQKMVKQEEEAPAQKESKKKALSCKQCGNSFQGKDNKGSKTPCHYHPGMSTTVVHLISHLNRLRPYHCGKYRAD